MLSLSVNPDGTYLLLPRREVKLQLFRALPPSGPRRSAQAKTSPRHQASNPNRPKTKKKSAFLAGLFYEADARTRTGDPFITSEVLYQLSYVGRRPTVARLRINVRARRPCFRAWVKLTSPNC